MIGFEIEVRSAVLPFPARTGGALREPRANPAFDWTVEAGTCHVVIGESGSGKTTLLRVLLGLVPLRAGTVRVGPFQHPLRTARERAAFARAVAVIPQDAVGSLDPLWSAWRIVAEPLVIHGVVSRRAEARERASQLLAGVGLTPDLLDRRPAELSGGQCQRVAVARALALSPSLILADEPFSSLDPVRAEEVLDLLMRVRERARATLVLVSHSLWAVRTIADRVTVFADGRPVETASPERSSYRSVDQGGRRPVTIQPEM